jgi:hypothetical protein
MTGYTMKRTCLSLLLAAAVVGLGLSGCAEQASPSQAAEDPEVAAYLKSKGWSPMRDWRIFDGKLMIIVSVVNPARPYEHIRITLDDYKMLARSRTVQGLNLHTVKNTDEGLKLVAGIPQLETIVVGGDDVTDAGVKELARCRSLDCVELSTKKVTDAGIKELAALPKLQALSLRHMTLTASAFKAFAGSRTLRWVSLEYVNAADAAVKELAALPNLQKLSLTGMTLTGSTFEAFAGSRTLRSVILESVNGFTDDGARHLARLPNLDELKINDRSFGEAKLTAAGIKAIVDARLPAKFEFDTRLIDDDLLEALVGKGWLYGPTPAGAREKRPATPAEVRYIGLGDSKVTDRGVRAVLNCTNATGVSLGQTGVTDETLRKLAAFTKLEYLTLDRTKVTAAGLDAISGLPIRRLGMAGCELTEGSFKALGKMAALEELRLTDAKMKAEWLKHIAALPKLKSLTLMRADFDDAAVKYVSTMPSLEDLTLNNTKLGDKGFQELVNLPRLQMLYVDGTEVSRAVYQKAKKEHPKLRLYFYEYDR